MTNAWQDIYLPESEALDLSSFKDMDYYAVKKFYLPIELMMENAGWALAIIVAASSNKKDHILIGAGNGNNGGGGLVAARRLAGWGYTVHLDLPVPITKPLPLQQLKRAVAFGALIQDMPEAEPDIWVDAYLGFSQYLPLSTSFTNRIKRANALDAKRIALDIPTGFTGKNSTLYFKANTVICLAAAKKILFDLDKNTEIFISDLGIPQEVYQRFHTPSPPFDTSPILRWSRFDQK